MRKKLFKKGYVVVYNSEVVYATPYRYEAEEKAEELNTLQPGVIDDDASEKDIMEAHYQDGYENGVHLVCRFDITDFDPDESDEVELTGDVSTESVDYYDLIQKIKEY